MHQGVDDTDDQIDDQQRNGNEVEQRKEPVVGGIGLRCVGHGILLFRRRIAQPSNGWRHQKTYLAVAWTACSFALSAAPGWTRKCWLTFRRTSPRLALSA